MIDPGLTCLFDAANQPMLNQIRVQGRFGVLHHPGHIRELFLLFAICICRWCFSLLHITRYLYLKERKNNEGIFCNGGILCKNCRSYFINNYYKEKQKLVINNFVSFFWVVIISHVLQYLFYLRFVLLRQI